jgi:hypothetical protein
MADEIHNGWKRSGKFTLLNDVNRYSQGGSVTRVLAARGGGPP